MYCETCNSDMEVYIDDEGNDYIEPCVNCTAEIYADGVKDGWKVAGKDIEDLAEALRECKCMVG